jgi:hypothetical protein
LFDRSFRFADSGFKDDAHHCSSLHDLFGQGLSSADCDPKGEEFKEEFQELHRDRCFITTAKRGWVTKAVFAEWA